MKLSFSTLGCSELSWEAACKLIGENGYQGVDIRFTDGRKDPLQNPVFSPDNVEKARKVAESNRLEIPCFASGIVLTRKDQIQVGKTSIDLANALHAPRLRVFMGEPEKGVSDEDAMFLASEQGHELAEYGQEKGVKIILETHDYCSASVKTLEIVERVDHANFGILWDSHHTKRAAGEAFDKAWALVTPYCDYIHIKDSLGDKSKFHYTLAGEGNLEMDKLMELLSKESSVAWACVEWERAWHQELPEASVAAPNYIQYVQRFIKLGK